MYYYNQLKVVNKIFSNLLARLKVAMLLKLRVINLQMLQTNLPESLFTKEGLLNIPPLKKGARGI
jgi:hypothetical protein